MQTPYVFQKSIKALRFSAVHSLFERSSIWIQEVKMPSLSLFARIFFCTVRPAVVTEVHTESSQIFCRYISDEILHNRKIRTVFISKTLLKKMPNISFCTDPLAHTFPRSASLRSVRFGLLSIPRKALTSSRRITERVTSCVFKISPSFLFMRKKHKQTL